MSLNQQVNQIIAAMKEMEQCIATLDQQVKLIRKTVGAENAITSRYESMTGIPRNEISLRDKIVRAVMLRVDITEEALKSGRRQSQLVAARKAITLMLINKTKMTYEQIAKVLNVDHSTIYYYVESHERDRKESHPRFVEVRRIVSGAEYLLSKPESKIWEREIA
jgi:chromosomal replication initiation ATPase DnaA